ncbi:MAG: nucleotidyl transferase AbiEii/AbiGii toxin family protein [Bacteroidales bacterium]|nr:nucleotidyl transferase AbiEii/AbiGii toxin family protein [Bacteroidales bacterium]
MEKFTKKDLRNLVENTGYPMASIEKTIRLLDLLKKFNADEFLKSNLVLKGGTAINVIYYSELRRLSVDLDFDLARNTPKDEMLEIKNKVSEKIAVIVEELEYELKDPKPNYALHQMELYYHSVTGNRDKIKLDINCLSRCHIYEPIVKTASNPFDKEDVFPVRILSEYELFGAKLKALLERYTPRDIFDAYTLEDKGLFREESQINSIRKCIAYYLSLTTGVDVSQALMYIKSRGIQDFKKQLFPMLKTGYGFVDHDKMSSDAVKCVSRYLEFTKEEQEYLIAAENGCYLPELLFDRDISSKIQDNPAAKFYILSRNQK